MEKSSNPRKPRKSYMEWLTAKYPDGIYTQAPRNFVQWADKYLSINFYYKHRVRKKLKIDVGFKTPAWVSELYQTVSVVIAVVFLVTNSFLPDFLRICIAVLALYRPLEIVLFSVAWVFIHKDPLHSYTRSLVGFLVNIMEIVLFYAAAYQGFGLIPSNSMMTAFYSSLRTTVTIGPIGTLEPPDYWASGLLITGQILTSYFVSVIIIAHVIGALRRSQVVVAH